MAGFHSKLLGQKQGQARLDSLYVMLSKVKADSNKVNLLNDLSFSYYPIDPEKGIKYGYEGLELSQKIDWKPGIASSYRNIGVNYGFGKSDFIKSLDFYNKSLLIFKELNHQNGIAKVYGHIGAAYYEQSEFSKAISYYFQALKIFENQGDKIKIATLLGNIAIVYNDQKEYEVALQYNFKALHLYEELKDKSGLAKIYGNIGNVYANDGVYERALTYHFKSLNLKKNLGLKNGIALVTGNIGDVYMRQGNFSKANEYFNNSLNQFKELNDQKSIALNLGNIGELYLLRVKKSSKSNASSLVNGEKKSFLLKAKKYVDSSIIINKEINFQQGVADKHKLLSEINELLGNNAEALANYKTYTALKDSIFTAEKDKKITQIVMRYEYQKAEEDRKRKLEIAKTEKERSEQTQILGISIFIVLFIAFLLIVSKLKVSFFIIKILSIFSVLLVFEFLILLLHKRIEKVTHHNLILTLLCLVIVASIVIPIHHKAEKWFTKKLEGRIKYQKSEVRTSEIACSDELDSIAIEALITPENQINTESNSEES